MVKSILGSFSSVEEKRRDLNSNDIELVYYKDIKPADKNRKIKNVKELAEDILEDGLEHNILLRELENNSAYKYEIIAGHRRYSAILMNIDNNHMEYEYIPSKIKRNVPDYEARRRLHLNNMNQQGYTPAEMVDAIEELEEIYKTKKKENGLPGRIQTLLADDIGLKKSQVGNYQYIINNAIPKLRELLRSEIMPLNSVLELSSLDEENQLMFIETAKGFDFQTIKEYKELMESSSREPVDKDYVSSSLEQECDEEYQKDNDEKIEVQEKGSTSVTTNTSTSDLTMQDITNSIDELHYELKSKMNPSEWKVELDMLENIMELFEDFKNTAGLL